jgi:hypothetical protein
MATTQMGQQTAGDLAWLVEKQAVDCRRTGDYLGAVERFQLAGHLYSEANNTRRCLQCFADAYIAEQEAQS